VVTFMLSRVGLKVFPGPGKFAFWVPLDKHRSKKNLKNIGILNFLERSNQTIEKKNEKLVLALKEFSQRKQLTTAEIQRKMIRRRKKIKSGEIRLLNWSAVAPSVNYLR
jgi:hypothetical protein